MLEVKDLKDPATVAVVAVSAGLILKKVTKMSLGIEGSMEGLAKSFALITAAGAAVEWYNRKE